MNLKSVFRSYINNIVHQVRDEIISQKELAQNNNIKNMYTGKRVFILGSGGSINKYDVSKLRNEFVMTQNNFHAHPDIEEINPEFHCVVPFYQTSEEHSVWVDWIQEMNEKLPSSKFFWGLNTKGIIEENFPELGNRSYYLKPGYNALTLSKAKVDISKTITRIPTATTQCITVALYLGFSEIYLLGFDNDQIFHERKKQNRFYGVSKITNTKAEENILNKQRETKITTSWYNKWLTSVQLDLLGRYAEDKSIRIINASKEGVLDNYPRVALVDIVGTDMLK